MIIFLILIPFLLIIPRSPKFLLIRIIITLIPITSRFQLFSITLIRLTIRRRFIRLTMFIVIISMLVKPSSIPVEMKYKSCVFYCERTTVWKIGELMETLRLMTLIHFFRFELILLIIIVQLLWTTEKYHDQGQSSREIFVLKKESERPNLLKRFLSVKLLLNKA